MERVIISNIPFELDKEQVFSAVHMEDSCEDAQALEQLIGEAVLIGRPKAACRISYIESRGDDYVILDNIKFTSRVLKINLDHVNRVFPYIATCGTELESWAISKKDPLEQYWAYTINQLILGKAIQAVMEHIKASYNPGKMSQMNPGSLESWPINQQKELFSLLGGAADEIGVELTESFLMKPVKSVSGIYFANESTFENCQLCPREKCPNRRAPYDRELLNKKYK